MPEMTVISGSTITGNGMGIFSSVGLTISDSTVSENVGDGIISNHSTAANIVANINTCQIAGNGGSGFYGSGEM